MIWSRGVDTDLDWSRLTFGDLWERSLLFDSGALVVDFALSVMGSGLELRVTSFGLRVTGVHLFPICFNILNKFVYLAS